MSPPSVPPFDLTAGPFSLSADGSGGFLAKGPLTFGTARAARELALGALDAGDGTLLIDCQGITSSDSAGLAVLLDWLAAARAQGRSLRFTHLPQGLAALGRISDVNELLERGV